MNSIRKKDCSESIFLTGYDFEMEILNASSLVSEEVYKSIKYEPLELALVYASRRQDGWNPKKKKFKGVAKKILAEIEKQFFLEYGSVPDLRMYRTVGTSADFYH